LRRATRQQEVEAVRREHAFTYGENGGDGMLPNFVERSFDRLRSLMPRRAVPVMRRVIVRSPAIRVRRISRFPAMTRWAWSADRSSTQGGQHRGGRSLVAEMQAEMRKMRAEMDCLRGGEPEESE
jgi:hypothetical protein